MIKMKEIWRDIKDFEGLYNVSNFGRVKSLKRTAWNGHGVHILRERILKITIAGQGKYNKVTLRKNNYSYQKYIHRLVGQEFIKNPLNKEQINHKNGNKQDNNINNLEWCTSKENMNHSYKNKFHLSGENYYNAIFKNKTIIDIRKQFNNGVSQKDLSEKYNIDFRHIHSIVRNKTYKRI